MMKADAALNLRNPDCADVQLIQGHWFDDGWLSKECELLIQPKVSVSGLSLRFWNPDFAIAYRANKINIHVNNEDYASSELAMGENVEFKLELNVKAGERLTMIIASSAFCSPNGLDQRERSVVLADAVLFLDQV